MGAKQSRSSSKPDLEDGEEAHERKIYTADELMAEWIAFERLGSMAKKKTNRSIKRASSTETGPLSFPVFQTLLKRLYPDDIPFYNRIASCFDDDDSNEVTFQDAAVTINFFEKSTPTEKLKFLFRAFDSNNDGLLSPEELHNSLLLTTSNAIFLGQSVADIRPMIDSLIKELDTNHDGLVSLEEWVQNGINALPLLKILGHDALAAQGAVEGVHEWKIKHFSRAAFCVVCRQPLSGLVKKALVCHICNTVCHRECMEQDKDHVVQCRGTCVYEMGASMKPEHHWVDGNGGRRCIVCSKPCTRAPDDACTCSWCHETIHQSCKQQATRQDTCSLGVHRESILPAVSVLGDKETGRTINIIPLAHTQPVLVFVNSKSGGGQGLRVLRLFRRMLNPRQVCDLSELAPRQTLQLWAKVPHFRIVCCGGDGTVGWVLSVLDTLEEELDGYQPPIGIIPLGTGNDLSRCLNWGGGFKDHDDLHKLLGQLRLADRVPMDRWHLTFTVAAETTDGDPYPLTIVNNYFSIGVDASIALRFHIEREQNPAKFRSRAKNKFFYAQFGAEEAFKNSCAHLEQDIELVVDGKPYKLPNLQGIAVLNIPSMYGGSNLWGTQQGKQYEAQHIGDKLFEVVGIYGSLHVGQIKGGLRQSARRIAQGSSLVLTTKKLLPMQIDGEPWMQSACTVELSHHNQAVMLRKKERKASRVLQRHKSSGQFIQASLVRKDRRGSAPSFGVVPEEDGEGEEEGEGAEEEGAGGLPHAASAGMAELEEAGQADAQHWKQAVRGDACD
eukprot:m.67002 g.67002  ORF g.67002 m.67002 type:complete len:783 (-) comp16599_c0_seq2:52-2400(-)